MARIIKPRLDAEGLPRDFRLPAAVLRDRIEDDPSQAQRLFSQLVEAPSPSESDYAILTQEVGQQGSDAIRTYRTIILSGLLRWLSYDRNTLAAINSDEDYARLRASRQPNMSAKQLEEHQVKIGATELYYFAGQLALAKEQQANEAPTGDASVIPFPDFNKTA